MTNFPYIAGTLAIPYRTFHKGLHVLFSVRADKTAFIGETESEEGHCYFTTPVQSVSLENDNILKVKTLNSEIVIAFAPEYQIDAFKIYRFFSKLPKSESVTTDTTELPAYQARA